MPNERDEETQRVISREIKTIQNRCVETIQIIENAPPVTTIAPEEVSQKAVSYIKGLRSEIQNSNTPIITDDNLLTSQFLYEIKEKTVQMKEFGAYLRGAINDVDAEINRLSEQIRIAQEARSRPRPQNQQIKPEHLKRSKEQFHHLKTILHGVIDSLYPDKAMAMKEFLGNLMSEKLKESSNGYIQISPDNYSLVALLLERNIVSVNPYNKMEVKLAY